MYITFFISMFIAGLLLLFLPSLILKKRPGGKVLSVILQVLGAAMSVLGAISIYAVLSGRIVLPLIQ